MNPDCGNDRDVPDMMEEVLTYEGYEVKGLTETKDIFPEIAKYRPDIIILDYIFNGINGGELYHHKINRYTTDNPGGTHICLSACVQFIRQLWLQQFYFETF